MADGKEAKRDSDRNRGKTRVNLGGAFPRWRELRNLRGFKNDIQLALILLDYYLRTRSESRPERCSSSDNSESMNSEYPFLSSPIEDEQAAPFVQSSENVKRKKDAACQRSEGQEDVWQTTRQSQDKENRDNHEDEDEEFSTSLSVGDGRYLVDLGSSSEFIVDEECILQLLKSCRECNKQCSVRKRVQGLKLVVYQTCRFCQSRYTWTNLPDGNDDGCKDNSDPQINGKDAAHGQTDRAMSSSSSMS